MEGENPKSKQPRIALHGREVRQVRRSVTEEGEVCFETGHGIAGATAGKSKKSGSGLTFMQIMELQHQTLIYKHMEAGIPVPYHLIFPILKSISSLTPFTGYCTTSLMCNYKNKMEAEPERCKRTDGKKWRCTKNVVPDHKYCQRHLHRGRSLHNSTSSVASTSSSHQDSNIDLSINSSLSK